MTDYDPYAAAFDTVTAILAETAVPVGASGALYAAHDALAASGARADADDCGRASVALLRLESAMRRGDAETVADARALLAELHAKWSAEEPEDLAEAAVAAGDESFSAAA